MFVKDRKRIAELEDRVCEQAILIHHQEEMLSEKEREIGLLREQVMELMREREQMREMLNAQQKEEPTFAEIIDEWINGKDGKG